MKCDFKGSDPRLRGNYFLLAKKGFWCIAAQFHQ